MKNIFKSSLLAMMALVAMTACEPQESDDHLLGTSGTISLEEITYIAERTEKSPNEIVFTNTTVTKVPYSFVWDLDNGATSRSKAVTAQYPEKGAYSITLTIYTADGGALSKVIPMQFENDDFSLLDIPLYNNLTGGASATDGKTWVFDQYNNYTKVVSDAVAGFTAPKPAINAGNIKGHTGLGPLNTYAQEWWGAGPNEKSAWDMYDMKFTFIQSGLQMKVETAGKGYGRWALAHSKPGAVQEGEDVVYNYAGGTYNFALDDSGPLPQLTLTGDATMGYYCGTQTYDIVYQSEEVMALCVHNSVESQDWLFIYCREDLNVSTPPIVKTPKAVPLSEDFEDDEAAVNFVTQNMGDKSAVVDNPAPVPINESNKAYRYQKSTDFYSNLSFTTTDYMFDLTTQNKIRVKVYIPSYNDYTTEFAVAGDWITNKKLLPQLAVKLQDSSKGDNAWETQVEIVKANLELDKWLELEFDFSSAATRKDFDKIVIQFGAEGHAGPGFFYFDDFSFDE
ncbi:PKD domain-containing protein [Bacteroides sp. UBA939]|uniref:PKD domain-containing protein n=1 Tax=Bacteroides sp. UBA939 TaxID=1946092 RepID=UPI0025B7C5EC|nr:PKD domain-containing protein [Bacteroides sp. UBA939]